MADPEWVKIKFAAGHYPDEAPGEAEAYHRFGSWCRYELTDDQKVAHLTVIGGWERATFDTFEGKMREIVQHATNATYPYAVMGGNTSTWSLYDSELYFTTPIVSYGTLSSPFSTTLNDPTVTVAHTSHGRETGDFVNFPESPVVTGSGITLTSGYYEVTKIDANSYTIEGPNDATAAVSGVGGVVDYEYFLASGNEFGLGGAGYSTGAYDVGTYGGITTAQFVARTWTFAPFGQNIIGAPRYGGVYELSPYFGGAITELVTNGSFTGSATGWTLGANWAYSSNAAAATLADTALSQDITVTAGTWNLLKFSLTRAAGTVAISVDGETLATLNATGRYFARFWGGDGGTQTLAFTGTGFTGTVDTVSAKILGTFAPLLNAPTLVSGVTVTPYLHVMVWGCVPDGSSTFDPMCIKTSDAEDAQDWTISLAGEAREYFLGWGSRIVRVLQGEANQMYALTDTAFGVGTYTPSPTVVWRWDVRGQRCGLIGVNAVCVGAGRVWWMGNNKAFYVFDGAAVTPLTCSGTKWVFDNLDYVQQDLIKAWHNPAFNEIWWHYGDIRDAGNEVSRYAVYNYKISKWYFGSRDRTSMGEAGPFPYPLGADPDGNLYFHEKGAAADGGPLDWSIESGAFDIGDGNTLHEISGYIPDVRDQEGSYVLEILGYEANLNSPPETSGEVTISPATEYANGFFVQGRQTIVQMRGNAAPMRLRLGDPRFLIQDTGNQF